LAIFLTTTLLPYTTLFRSHIVFLYRSPGQEKIIVARNTEIGQKSIQYFFGFIIFKILNNRAIKCAATSFMVGLEENIIFIAFTQDRKSTRLNSSHVKISYA